MTALESSLNDRLTASVNDVIAKHKSTMLPVLVGKSTDLSVSLLKNDDAVRKVALICYGLLPGLVRFAVKEPVFVGYVMNNRERVLSRLVEHTA